MSIISYRQTINKIPCDNTKWVSHRQPEGPSVRLSRRLPEGLDFRCRLPEGHHLRRWPPQGLSLHLRLWPLQGLSLCLCCWTPIGPSLCLSLYRQPPPPASLFPVLFWNQSLVCCWHSEGPSICLRRRPPEGHSLHLRLRPLHGLSLHLASGLYAVSAFVFAAGLQWVPVFAFVFAAGLLISCFILEPGPCVSLESWGSRCLLLVFTLDLLTITKI